MDPTQVTVLIALAPFIVGGSVLYWIGKTHPTREEVRDSLISVMDKLDAKVAANAKDLDRVGAKLNEAREDIKVNRAMADEALHRAEHAKTEVNRQHEHIERNLIGPIRELTGKINSIEIEMAKQGASARFVEKTLAEIKDWLDEDDRTTRRHP